MPSSVHVTGFRFPSAKFSKSRLLAAFSFGKSAPTPFLLTLCDAKNQSFTANKFKRMAWSLRSATDGSRLNSTSSANDSFGGTRLIRAIRTVRVMLINRLKQLRRNLPVKLFFFLVGFYCATAFATVIGQTGDWDVLSAALAVALVEGIGALMYKLAEGEPATFYPPRSRGIPHILLHSKMCEPLTLMVLGNLKSHNFFMKMDQVQSNITED